MSATSLLVDATVVVSVSAAAAAAFAGRRRSAAGPGPGAGCGSGPAPDPGPGPGPARGSSGGRTRRGVPPEAALAAVTGLIYLNQVLFTVYVLRVHGGDTSFIARHLPAGWFALADGNPALRALADRTPAPWMLAPSLLRVQAFLELPFVVLVFMVILRRLDPALHRRAAHHALTPLACASYTAVFCIVEWDLRNPYTVQDIALRLASAAVTPRLVRATAGRGPDAPTVVTPRGLLVFTADLWAIGHLVLTVYDTALLYNLGHLGAQLPWAAAALAVLAVTGRIPRGAVPAGPATTVLASGLGRALLLFYVPALAVRYGVTFGTPAVAAGAGALLLTAAAVHAVRSTGPRPAVAAGLALALTTAAAAAAATARWTVGTTYESTLLRAAVAGAAAAIAVCALTDGAAPHLRRSPSGPE
ncbi:hypothetical protein KNE206_64970 [Kitasatospora sp. NE20-6]|uniref:hypothetical protein n=1 Tax=Kitasatospora sp. NE20-6 TaxID=2859066 RepID=UPI0034DC1FA0